ncbi:MAG: cysteine synthase [Deltaproteobacteria bacterium]|nr:cysteine synthase [Deltaproteobacteria bacterium]
MKNVFSNILECIGNTPLIRINRLNPNPGVTLYAKWEAKNPGGSIKDRPALHMIEAAEKQGLLKRGRIIIEATSGNTGIGLAMVAAVKGYRLVLAMPETASLERQKILKALGAEILLTPGALGTDGAIEKVYEMVRENPDRYFMPDQFNNPANPAAHELGTGPEIIEQTEGKVSAVVVTLGTTGTAMGILRAMKASNPGIEVIGVEPYPGHKVQGLKNMKESYVPGIFDRHALDRVIHIRDEEAFEMARRLAREEGIFAGMSSGAAMAGAVAVAREMKEGIVVTVLPDGGDRYLSTNLFTTLLEPDFRFFDLLTREKTDFKPLKEGKARIATTGPPLDRPLTIQDSRRFIVSDLLTRFLQSKGFYVDQVVLIPDLDSRTVQGSIAAAMDLSLYVQRQLEDFLRVLNQLGIQRGYRCVKTSERLDVIESNTRALVAREYAYEKLRSIYFDLTKSRDYGALSKIDLKKIRLGTTVDLDAYEKLNPRDFTLLKRATLAELKRGICMKTEWGNVLPTWHIASASAAIHDLGSPIDIQVSSMDFLFPHLENVREIGQALTGKPFANIWMVCERIWSGKDDRQTEQVDGNTAVMDLLEQGLSPGELRYWLLSTHYRKPLHINRENIRHAAKAFHRLREFINRIHHTPCTEGEQPSVAELTYRLEQGFFEALADDLNTPRAIAALFRFAREINLIMDHSQLGEAQKTQLLETLQRLNAVLGLFDLQLRPLGEVEDALLKMRAEARRNADWQRADELRNELLRLGIRVTDTPSGTRWEWVEPKEASAS